MSFCLGASQINQDQVHKNDKRSKLPKLMGISGPIQLKSRVIHILQHDENFVAPLPGLGWSPHPNEHFFLRRFNNASTITGAQLRREEEKMFRLRYSAEESYYHMHIRDYHRLCRGDSIVNYHRHSLKRCSTIQCFCVSDVQKSGSVSWLL